MSAMDLLLLDSEDVAWFRDELTGARGAAAALARRVGFDEQRAADVALAVSETATNLAKHAVDGAMLLRVVRTEHEAGVEVVAVDSGPGIADVGAALRDGMSTTGTLGIGLGAVRRLADVFDLHSLPGRGTVLAARFWPGNRGPRGAGEPDGPRGPGEPVVAGLTRAISGERVCGDAWAARLDPPGSAGSAGGGSGPALMLMMCDGLGHGPMAALASEGAVRAFRHSRARTPELAVQDVHLALRGTRGAAVAVARIEPEANRLTFCGIGNIAAVLVQADERTSLLSFPGIVGHQMRGLRTFEQPLPPHGALVMHSDGLTDRWNPADLPGLLQHSPVVVAAHLLRHAGVRRDDAGVVVAKGLW